MSVRKRFIPSEFESVILNIVIGNPPAHCTAERVTETMAFRFIRLGPYIVALNGIELCWSLVNSSLKRQLSSPR